MPKTHKLLSPLLSALLAALLTSLPAHAAPEAPATPASPAAAPATGDAVLALLQDKGLVPAAGSLEGRLENSALV